MMISPVKILIIDDTYENRLYLSKILQAEGFFPIEAEGGPEGREIAKKEKPDLIILDLMMPGESGITTCQLLKEDPITFSIPVVFLSADQTRESVIKGLKAGGVDYIAKPFDPEEVILRIRIHIQLQSVQRQLIAKHTEDLQSISEAQQAILMDPSTIPEAKAVVYHKPLREAGGDYYDIIKLSENQFVYICADVAGHELGSIVTSAALKTAIRQYASVIYTPVQMVTQINQLLNKVIEEDLFVTLTCVLVNKRKKKITLINAGHPYPVILMRNGTSQVLRERGQMLGIMESPLIKVRELEASEVSRIFLFTDGLVDEIRSSEAYQEIQNILESTWNSPLAEQLGKLEKGSFQKGKRDDDVLLMGIEV